MNTFTSCECVDNLILRLYNNIMNTSLINTCCFFGHRKITTTENLIEKLSKEIERLIVNENCTRFLFGGFGEFDELCFQTAKKLKSEKYNFINLTYCCTDEKDLRRKKISAYYSKFDNVIYLPLDFDYWYTRIYYRNLEIIKNSNFAIFYVTNTENSGAYKILTYAKTQKITIINLAD